jgi:hypothetical protein
MENVHVHTCQIWRARAQRDLPEKPPVRETPQPRRVDLHGRYSVKDFDFFFVKLHPN